MKMQLMVRPIMPYDAESSTVQRLRGARFRDRGPIFLKTHQLVEKMNKLLGLGWFKGL